MRLLALTLAAVCAAACHKTTCDEIQPVPIAGTYKGGGNLGEARLLNVGVEAKAKQVVLTYTAMDGSRIRATYKVGKKTKQH